MSRLGSSLVKLAAATPERERQWRVFYQGDPQTEAERAYDDLRKRIIPGASLLNAPLGAAAGAAAGGLYGLRHSVPLTALAGSAGALGGAALGAGYGNLVGRGNSLASFAARPDVSTDRYKREDPKRAMKAAPIGGAILGGLVSAPRGAAVPGALGGALAGTAIGFVGDALGARREHRAKMQKTAARTVLRHMEGGRYR